MTKTINVVVPEELFKALKHMMVEVNARTWQEFLRYVLDPQVDVWIEILEVNEQPAKGQTVKFKMGESIYLFDGENIVDVSTPIVKFRSNPY